MLSTDPRWPHPNRSETSRQMARAVEEEREGVVRLERTETPEAVMERVMERSETGKYRAQPRNPVTKPKAKMRVRASKPEVVREEVMEPEPLEAETEVAKAEMDISASKPEVVREEAMEPERLEAETEVAKAEMRTGAAKAKLAREEAVETGWPESWMDEVSAPASKTKMAPPSLPEKVG